LDKLVEIRTGAPASREQIERFHTREYVEIVIHAERDGLEFLDNGDTPVFPGVYDAGAMVTGAALDGLTQVMRVPSNPSADCITRAATARPGSACSTTWGW
jgi:acetoin utilization protein AcuC